MEKGFVKIVSPIDDTPGYKAGLKAGDLIIKIDDIDVSELSLNEAVTLMRGKIGTNINLIIRRRGDEDFTVTITRAIIKVRSVKDCYFTNSYIGYLRVSSFTKQTTIQLRETIEKILERKPKGFILDLRNNPGGLLEQALSVSDLFLDSGKEIVSTKGRTAWSKDKRFFSGQKNTITEKPLVVLINGGSASASEIVAGALKDNERAKIIGTRSFGKGSLQDIMPLNNGGAIKLTIAKYYLPSGISIHDVGIKPDDVVEQGDNQLFNCQTSEKIDLKLYENDLQLNQAVKSLINGNYKPQKQKSLIIPKSNIKASKIEDIDESQDMMNAYQFRC